MPLTPNNREEYWLQGMVDGQTTLEPNKRREYWYKEIVDAIGSGGGGGGGGTAVINVTDVPYVAQALQTNVTSFVTNALTNTPNEPDYHYYTTVNENAAANMESIVTFLTENEGKSIYLVSDGAYQPVTYKASTGYVGIKMKNPGSGYAYDLDIEIVAVINDGVITGVGIAIYGWVTTNV